MDEDRRPLCVITDFMGDDTTEEVSLFGDQGIDVFVSPGPEPAAWLTAATGADAILTRHAPIGSREISAMERCRIIARYGTGHDNIDLEAAMRRGITVTAVVDYATAEVADHTMALILALSRALPSFERSIRAGGWTPRPLPDVPRLAGRTLGLLGCGRIGAAVARRAAAFDIDVVVYDPYAPSTPEGTDRAPDLESLLQRADILSLHAPLTTETANLISSEEIGMLPPGAIIVNVARGGLLDLDAAMAAIGAGHLGGLGVDVAAVEPLAQGHPARNHPRVIVTPHVGYYSAGSVVEAKRRSVGEIVRVLTGLRPHNPVYAHAGPPGTEEET